MILPKSGVAPRVWGRTKLLNCCYAIICRSGGGVWTYIAYFTVEKGIIRNHRLSQFAAVFRGNNFTPLSPIIQFLFH
ncbi:hypothetical protein D3OALGA1CA_851 [Olavius algarvensis associated proteobacterium Delta 3]|nr:hypothetical protein D3OALGA1CA_851 [Olavius algarvensis associated proteobacterium Delta 3]CAB5143134.1 hypothetical protein D3OALGB2SA_4354 [Olavius algarvensis associated proteobacterium Delta 3]